MGWIIFFPAFALTPDTLFCLAERFYIRALKGWFSLIVCIKQKPRTDPSRYPRLLMTGHFITKIDFFYQCVQYTIEKTNGV